ncbi:hypothetical protein [Spirillospora albida]|uniref:hypothetical protein n=1 Tax=Spirillospora albida TaxID=58123 RepID=UPI00068E0B30|nr:hypothetical protein [Spirillospora albida]
MPSLHEPTPLGYAEAAKELRAVAAPLLTAAALALAGVVAGTDNKDNFRWPGLTLLILVVSSLLFIASLQLHYNARRYLYSYAEIENWYGSDIAERQPHIFAALCAQQRRDFRTWEMYGNNSTHSFNVGSLLLMGGVALALIPQDGKEMAWRWGAVVVIAICAAADLVWTVLLYRGGAKEETQRNARMKDVPIHIESDKGGGNECRCDDASGLSGDAGK